MGLKHSLATLLLASVPLGLAHPGDEKVYQHRARPLEQRSLDHCDKHFSEAEFVKRTVDIHSAEFERLRRAAGFEDVKYGDPKNNKRCSSWSKFIL
jgi:hypothetical protein